MDKHIIIEEDQEFSHSCLWNWQQKYYNETGVETWRDGRTPHYITSNARIARNYVEIVLAFYRDLLRRGVLQEDEPIHLLELGAGSGRFSYHFLHWLRILCDVEGIDWRKFRYILSDVAAANLDFCRQHPKLQTAFDAGVLDVAQLDVTKPGPIRLERTSQEITPASLRNPLILIANYLFDSLPHQLFHLDGGNAYLGYVTLTASAESQQEGIPVELSLLDKSLHYRKVTEPLFANTSRNQLLAHYQNTLESTHMLFPGPALDALDYFRTLSPAGMIMLTADKGTHLLSDLDHCPPPYLAQHGGGFSVTVNFHAFAAHCRGTGGIALFPEDLHYYIDVGCLFYLPNASEYVETIRAYRQQIAEFGPDTFEGLIAGAKNGSQSYSMRGIFSHIQLSFYDSYVFDWFFPLLLELAPNITKQEKQQLIEYMHRIWDTYYTIGEPFCPANQIACLLYELDEFKDALQYFEKSIEINGPNTSILFNMGLCYQELNQHDIATKLFHEVSKYDSKNESIPEM